MTSENSNRRAHLPYDRGRATSRFLTVLSLVVGSVTLWASPASARDLEYSECLPLNPSAEWSGYWSLISAGPDYVDMTEMTITGETLTGDLSTDLVLTWTFDDKKNMEDLKFYVEFTDDSDCTNYVNPPEGICYEFSSASDWDPTSDDSSAYDYLFDGGGGYTFENLNVELGTEYEFDLSTVSGGDPATAQGYYFLWSDGPTTSDDVTFSVTLSKCGGSSGALRPHLNLEHLFDRTADETTSMPATL